MKEWDFQIQKWETSIKEKTLKSQRTLKTLFLADVRILPYDLKGNSTYSRDLFCKWDQTRIPFGLEGCGGQRKGVRREHLDLTFLNLWNRQAVFCWFGRSGNLWGQDYLSFNSVNSYEGLEPTCAEPGAGVRMANQRDCFPYSMEYKTEELKSSLQVSQRCLLIHGHCGVDNFKKRKDNQRICRPEQPWIPPFLSHRNLARRVRWEEEGKKAVPYGLYPPVCGQDGPGKRGTQRYDWKDWSST